MTYGAVNSIRITHTQLSPLRRAFFLRRRRAKKGDRAAMCRKQATLPSRQFIVGQRMTPTGWGKNWSLPVSLLGSRLLVLEKPMRRGYSAAYRIGVLPFGIPYQRSPTTLYRWQ
jgi:hypothetical protein